MSPASRSRQAGDKVLIWESDSLQGAYLSQLYGEAGYEALWLTGYQHLRDALKTLPGQPVLVVIGKLDRLQQLRSLQNLTPLASLLVLISTQVLDAGLQVLQAGADACFTLPIQPEALLAESQALLRQTRRVLRHGLERPAETLHSGPLRWHATSQEAELAGQRLILNGREARLLQYFAQHPNMLISRAELAALLDTGRGRPALRQVDNLLVGLRRKLPAHADFTIVTRYGAGYLCRIPSLLTD